MYKIRTRKKRPGVVSRIDLGELEVQVRATTRDEVLELLEITKNVTLVVGRWLCDEISLFKRVVWEGSFDSRLGNIWFKLDLKTRRKYAGIFFEHALEDEDPLVRHKGVLALADARRLRILSKSEDVHIQQAVALNRDSPVDALVDLSRKATSPTILGILVRRPDCPEEVREQLIDHIAPEVRRSIAMATTRMDLLERLSYDDDVSVRASVASRDICSDSLLERLACDEDPKVLTQLARNVKVPVSTLRKILDTCASLYFVPSNATYIKSLIARHKNCTADLLRELRKEAFVVRREVVRNENCPLDVLEELCQDSSWDVRLVARSRLKKGGK